MISRVRCLVGYKTRWALLLFELAMRGFIDVIGWVGWQSGCSTPILLGLSDHAALQPAFPFGLFGSSGSVTRCFS